MFLYNKHLPQRLIRCNTTNRSSLREVEVGLLECCLVVCPFGVQTSGARLPGSVKLPITSCDYLGTPLQAGLTVSGHLGSEGLTLHNVIRYTLCAGLRVRGSSAVPQPAVSCKGNGCCGRHFYFWEGVYSPAPLGPGLGDLCCGSGRPLLVCGVCQYNTQYGVLERVGPCVGGSFSGPGSVLGSRLRRE